MEDIICLLATVRTLNGFVYVMSAISYGESTCVMTQQGHGPGNNARKQGGGENW